MIQVDLAPAAGYRGAPPAHLLAPTAALLVGLPLMLSLVFHRAWSETLEQAAASEQQVASIRERAAASVAEHRRIESLQAVLDGARVLRSAGSATLALLPAVTAHLQPGTRLVDLSVDPQGVRISGTAASAAHVSLWLSRSAGRDEALVWEAPEIRDPAGAGRVEFGLRIRRTTASPTAIGP